MTSATPATHCLSCREKRRRLRAEEDAYVRAHHLPSRPAPEDWLFEWPVIEAAPIARPAYTARHAEALRYLVEVGRQLALGSAVRATCIVYYQRYYMHADHLVPPAGAAGEGDDGGRRGAVSRPHRPEASAVADRPFEPMEIAAAAVFLGAKVEESMRRLRDVIFVAVKTRTRHSRTHPGGEEVYEGTERYVQEKQRLLYAERSLLRGICFDLSVEHPYGYLAPMCSQLRRHDAVHGGEPEWWQGCFARAWASITESLMTPACLHYRARDLAAAALAWEAVDGEVGEREELERWCGWRLLAQSEEEGEEAEGSREVSDRESNGAAVATPACRFGVCPAEALEAIAKGMVKRASGRVGAEKPLSAAG